MCVCVCACESACAMFPVGDLLHFPSCSHVMSQQCMSSLGLDEVVHSGLFLRHCHSLIWVIGRRKLIFRAATAV